MGRNGKNPKILLMSELTSLCNSWMSKFTDHFPLLSRTVQGQNNSIHSGAFKCDLVSVLWSRLRLDKVLYYPPITSICIRAQ